MKVSVIVAHPDRGSLNHAIAATVVGALAGNGHEAILHDLYREGFDPILPARWFLSSRATARSRSARE